MAYQYNLNFLMFFCLHYDSHFSNISNGWIFPSRFFNGKDNLTTDSPNNYSALCKIHLVICTTIKRSCGHPEQEMDWAMFLSKALTSYNSFSFWQVPNILATLVRLYLIAQLVQELFFAILLMPRVMSFSSYIKIKYKQTFRAK